jgi:hypothetical protein
MSAEDLVLAVIHRRTFEAARHPVGAPLRAALNRDAVTSEYMTSQRYLVRRRFLMSDGTPHPTQEFIDTTFRTKLEAEISLALDKSKVI